MRSHNTSVIEIERGAHPVQASQPAYAGPDAYHSKP
jgi:hypothetical protein